MQYLFGIAWDLIPFVVASNPFIVPMVVMDKIQHNDTIILKILRQHDGKFDI